jgi:hypothetical protein
MAGRLAGSLACLNDHLDRECNAVWENGSSTIIITKKKYAYYLQQLLIHHPYLLELGKNQPVRKCGSSYMYI